MTGKDVSHFLVRHSDGASLRTNKLTQASGDEVAMTVRRGGNLVETRLMLQEMLP